ncbi:MAG: hypothetical protein QOK41_1270 [Sphingomonadales bacterium]|nr:hypothetical protein [Sphingomonadales bacterium]
MAEAGDIAVIAAALGARRGLEPGVVAIAFDELGGVGERGPAMDEGAVHGLCFTPAPVSRLPTKVVNGALTILGLARGARLCHGREMQPTTRAGGCFLTLCILAGFPLGLAIGNPMKGILIGVAAGVLLAVLTWLIDRRRRR